MFEEEQYRGLDVTQLRKTGAEARQAKQYGTERRSLTLTHSEENFSLQHNNSLNTRHEFLARSSPAQLKQPPVRCSGQIYISSSCISSTKNSGRS